MLGNHIPIAKFHLLYICTVNDHSLQFVGIIHVYDQTCLARFSLNGWFTITVADLKEKTDCRSRQRIPFIAPLVVRLRMQYTFVLCMTVQQSMNSNLHSWKSVCLHT